MRRFLRLTSGDRRLILSAALLLTLIRVGVRFVSFQRLRRLLLMLGPPPPALVTDERRKRHSPPSDRIAWAVAVASSYVPGTRSCLLQALAVQTLLARNGRPADLRIGVARGLTGHFEAHAWVESQGRIVIGGSQIEHYAPLAAFQHGRP